MASIAAQVSELEDTLDTALDTIKEQVSLIDELTTEVESLRIEVRELSNQLAWIHATHSELEEAYAVKCRLDRA